jgi:hypothetical protein
MALKKILTIIDDNNQTKTIATDQDGILFNIIIFNNHDSNDTNQPEIKYYYINNDGVEVILFKKKLEVNETFTWKPEMVLTSDDLKIYSTLKDVNVVTQILYN